MADFDRNADFKRTLRQLREVSGGSLELIPLGGDSLSGGGTPFQQLEAKQQADAAALTLRRYIEQAKLEERKLSGEIVKARTSGDRLRLAMSGDRRASLGQQLQADGFGKRGAPGGNLGGGPIKMSKGLLSRRGALKAIGGGPLLVTSAAMHLTGAGLNAIADIRDEYQAVKKAGGTDAQAREALVGHAKEKAVEMLGNIGGAKNLSTGIGRLFGMSEQEAEQRFTRYWSKTVNESGFNRRELAQANTIVNTESDTVKKWAKLDTSSPSTFRLRTKADASAYQNERRTANDLALTLGIFNENRKKFDRARNAAGN